MARTTRRGALADLLLAQPGTRTCVARDALETALEALWADAQRAWPTVQLEPARFIRYLAERLPEGTDLVTALAALPAADLYLACACAHGDPEALAAFERSVLPAVAAALRRTPGLGPLVDEVLQAVRVRLVVGEDGGRPGLHEYRGRGSLVRWTQVVAARLAVDLTRRRKTHGMPTDDAELARHAPGADPEVEYLKTRHAAEFSTAFREALTGLARRDRTVLRLHFVERLNIEQIGAIYRVHRATVARWIGRAREVLLQETRRVLADRWGLSARELDSLMRLVRSRVDVALSTIMSRAGRRPE